MLQTGQVEELIEAIGSMDRAAVTESLLSFRGSFPVDFTADFLDKLPTDRLRHIFAALCLQTGQVPDVELEPAGA